MIYTHPEVFQVKYGLWIWQSVFFKVIVQARAWGAEVGDAARGGYARACASRGGGGGCTVCV